jgi:predicted amidohydrolase YtcJ
MTRTEALASYTTAAAWAGFEEAAKGSLEVGKLADLVVLSKDVVEIAEDEIPSARVALTVVGGRVAYERP